MPDPAYFTVKEAAARLDISSDGVRKLISRGRLPALKRSAHKTLIPAPAFAAYLRELNQEPVDPGWDTIASPVVSSDSLERRVERFEHEHGRAPDAWVAAWRASDEDTLEAMRVAADAIALVAETQTKHLRQSGDRAPVVV